MDLTEESLRWVLEEHPQKFPYDESPARRIAAAINEYGISLWKQICLPSFIAGLQLELDTPPRVVLEVFDHGSDFMFQRLHWETIEKASLADGWQLFVRRAVPSPESSNIRQDEILDLNDIVADTENLAIHTQTPDHKVHELRSTQNPSRNYNILLVVSRPSKEDDINPLLGARAIFDALEMLSKLSPVKINVEIARPGTWVALVEHLESRTKAWHAKGGRGAWFDIVHFDVHGVVRNGVANLLFLSSKGTHALKRTAEMVGALLKANHIRFAVLNSCDSAKVAESQSSNLARTFVEMGLEAVVAMAFKFTSTAARLFLRVFYSRLFVTNELDMLDAVQYGREVLAMYPARVGRLNLNVNLPDFFVPVLYGTGRFRSGKPVSINLTPNILPADFSEELKEEVAELEGVDLDTRQKETNSLIGREQDILELEWLLLRSRDSNVIRLTGMVGAGKTALVKFLGDWWYQSRMVSHVLYRDFRHVHASDVIRYIQDRHESPSSEADQNRHILILDHLDVVTSSSGDMAPLMTEFERKQLTILIRRHLGRRDLLILVSRSQENWFSLPKRQHYRLGGLTSYHAATFTSQIISDMGMGEILTNRENIDYVEHLTCRLNYNPVSLKIFLGAMKSERAYLRSKGLDNAAMDRIGIMPDTPRDLYKKLLGGLIVVSPDIDPTWQECDAYIRWLWEQDFPRFGIALMSLAPPANTHCEDWYERVSHALGKFPQTPALSTDEIQSFVSKYLVDPGWVEPFEMTWADGTSTRYKRVHPLLTNAARILLHGEAAHKPLMDTLWNVFSNHYSILCINESAHEMTKTFRYQTQIESYNYLSSFDTFFEALVDGAEKPGLNLQVYFLLHVLIQTAMDSKSPVLTPDVVVPRLLQMIEYVGSRLQIGLRDALGDLQDNIDILLRLYDSLTEYYILRDPKEAGVCSEKCLKLLMVVCDGTEGWNSERRCLLAQILLRRGSSCLFYKDRAPEARQAFEMALRAFKPDDDSLINQKRSLDVRARGYRGLSDAVRALKDFYDVDVEPALIDIYEKEVTKATVVDFEDRDDVPRVEAGNNVESRSNTVITSSLKDQVADTYFRAFKIVEEASTYLEREDYQNAKDVLLSAIQAALLDNDKSAEHMYQTCLVDMAIAQEDYSAAAMHIARATELRSLIQGGLFTLEKPVERMFRAALYGSVYLRLGILIRALGFFHEALEARVGDNLLPFQLSGPPEKFLRDVVFLTRLGLLILGSLPKRLITPAQFEELDDMMQGLVLQFVNEKWPDYDPSGTQTRNLMKRIYTLGDGFDDLNNVPDGCGKRLVNVADVEDIMGLRRMPRSDESDEAAEQSQIEMWKAKLKDPKRVQVKGRNDYVLDLAPLEQAIPLYQSDPEGNLEGQLCHPLVDGYRHM